MNTIFVKFLVPAMLLGSTFAPSMARADEPEHHASVNARLHHQHARIEQGERTGALSGREANRLERRDRRIHRQEARDRRHNNGHLTAAERRHLQGRLNHTSHAIYRQKHDDNNR